MVPASGNGKKVTIKEPAFISKEDPGNKQDTSFQNKYDIPSDKTTDKFYQNAPYRHSAETCKTDNQTNDFCVGDLVSQSFECRNDNASSLRTHNLPRAQRRKLRSNRLNSLRHQICEFSCSTPLNQDTTEAKLLRNKSRLLDVRDKKDREMLTRMRRNLETLKSIAEDRRATGDQADPYKIYKELPGSVVNLYLTEDITVKPIDMVHGYFPLTCHVTKN